MSGANRADRYASGHTFAEFLESAEKLRDFWHGMARHASIGEELVQRVSRLGGEWHLLVLNADWCGDSVNTLPYIAKLVESAPNLDMRLLDRDSNPDLIEAHLTGGSRSIPKVIVLDSGFRECGSWGPRPAELQEWVRAHGLALPKADRYRELRAWYVRDRGRSAVAELITVLEGCAAAAGGTNRSSGNGHNSASSAGDRRSPTRTPPSAGV